MYLLLRLNCRVHYAKAGTSSLFWCGPISTRRKKDTLYKHSANTGHIHTCYVSLWSEFCTSGRPCCPHRGRHLVLFYPRETKVTLLRWSRHCVRFPLMAQLICLENKNENESHQDRLAHLSVRSWWSRCGLRWPLVGSVSTRTRIRHIQQGSPKFCLCENTLNFCKFKQQQAQVVVSVRAELMRLHSGHIRSEGTQSGYLDSSPGWNLFFFFSGASLSTL